MSSNDKSKNEEDFRSFMIRSFRGIHPEIADSAYVSEMAYVAGSVVLKEESSVWPFVCIRGDIGQTEVGARSNVQDHTMLHKATVGEDVTIGHHVTVDQAKVEGNCLLGINCSLLQGSVVESESVVAAGAVVREGQKVPEGHLAYGVPAEVKPLDDSVREQIRHYSSAYLSNARQWKKDGGHDSRDS